MQRDQWFQILIGSKRRELGNIVDEGDSPRTASSDLLLQIEEVTPGQLTEEEKEAVTLDLRPAESCAATA
jgi:hypothetical protein